MIIRLLSRLFRRSKHEPPLVMRTSWYEFAGRMRTLIALDLLADPALCAPVPPSRITAHITRIVAQPTRPLPTYDAAFYQDETMRVDVNATELVEAR